LAAIPETVNIHLVVSLFASSDGKQQQEDESFYLLIFTILLASAEKLFFHIKPMNVGLCVCVLYLVSFAPTLLTGIIHHP